jgi:hypothetical protein
MLAPSGATVCVCMCVCMYVCVYVCRKQGNGQSIAKVKGIHKLVYLVAGLPCCWFTLLFGAQRERNVAYSFQEDSRETFQPIQQNSV